MKPDVILDTILILDFGGQYCHLIGRRIRDSGVYSEVVPHDVSASDIKELRKKFNVKGIILSGGPASVYEKDSPQMKKEILDMGIPILGLCYGHQLIAHYVGGDVKPATKKEFGISFATIDKAAGILSGLGRKEKVWMSHGDTVFGVPAEFEHLAHTDNCPVAAFVHRYKKIYGLQWHPEVTHTEHGDKILKNFIFNVCNCESNWSLGDLAEKSVSEIKTIAGKKKVVVGLSGGVDSSVATILASKALGKNLAAVFVDHGFMRAGEPEEIKKTFEKFDLNFVMVDASEKFLKKLKGITDPEEKRKIIGHEFVRAFEDVAARTGADFLLQGTIYPDRIESGLTKKSDRIKTHHNVAGLPTKMKFKGVIEPLRDLYKDEVRRLGTNLGLPESIVNRQPFPGPGLAVRIIGEITKEKLDVLKRADRIVREEIEKVFSGKEIWQFFAVLTDTRSTGVKGDARSYGQTIAVRAVESREAMTASFARLPYDMLEKISTRITNEIPEVTRVVYDVTNKPPATIEWE